MKIRTRLSLQFFLLTAGIFTAMLAFTYKQFEQHVEEEVYIALESKSRTMAKMVLGHNESLRPLAAAKLEPTNLPAAANTTIYNSEFRPVFILNNVTDQLPPDKLAMIWQKGSCRFTNNDFFAFGIVMRALTGRTYLVVSEDIPDYTKLVKLRNILLVSFLISMAAIAVGGWFYAGQALKPVSHIVNEVDHILPADLSRRLQSDQQKDELSHLIDTFNRLLDRIEHAFQMQKNFISNVSHELKNPLAAMNAQIQLALNKPRTTEVYSNVLHSLHEDVQGIIDTSEKLLQLARVHSEAEKIVFSTVRLDELLYQTKENLLKLNPNYTARITLDDLPEQEEMLCVKGNEPLLRAAMLNLFDNGCKFSPDHTVHVNLSVTAHGQVQIYVKNQSEHIPDSDLKRIFEPFFRSSVHARQKGSGIGLSLVGSILNLHHSKIEFCAQKDLEACFLVTFPVFNA